MQNNNIRIILKLLKKTYHNAGITLKFSSNFEFLVAVILSAQCTDKRVNIVTKQLFKKYNTISDFASASRKSLEKDIHSVGFFRNKAKNIIASAKIIENQLNGYLPNSLEKMLLLPGVGRKTANVILHNLFSKNEGIAVDTHVRRISLRLGLVNDINPKHIELSLMKIIPQRDWGVINHLMIAHGRNICRAINPLCYKCIVIKYCPQIIKINR